jgi:aryl-alcohol dehydrogenase-like predicted oxidoreductase
MRQRALGRSSLLVSQVGLGTGNFGGRVEPHMARAVLSKALDLGVTLFDTADAYGDGRSEEVLAQALGARRKDVVIATKWGKFGWSKHRPADPRPGSRACILGSIEGSLRRLRTDYIDLYQLHEPDARTPIEETLTTLDQLIREGKVRYIGVSNMPAWQIVEAQLIARQLGMHGIVSFQDRYSLLARDVERTVFPATDRYGIALLPNYPLAEGLLTGKYRREDPVPEGTRLATWAQMRARSVNDASWSTLERLRAFAADRGHTLLELAMSWLATRPQVGSIIAGATRPEQLEQNIVAMSWELGAEDLHRIDQLTLAKETS